MKQLRQSTKNPHPRKNCFGRFPSLGKKPLIVGVLTSFGEATQVLELRVRPFDIIEWRLDLTGMGVGGGRWLQRCFDLEQAGIPVLLTIRSSAEGGKWTGEEAERLTLYRRGLEVVSAVDVEINSRLLPRLVASAHEHAKPLIGSFHDFSGTPPRAMLEDVIRLGWRTGVDIVKLATRLNAPADLALLLDLLGQGTPPRPLCIIGMGAPEARLELARAGSCLVYGFLGQSVAPGQLACTDLAAQMTP